MARQQQQLSKAEILQSQWQDIRTSGSLVYDTFIWLDQKWPAFSLAWLPTATWRQPEAVAAAEAAARKHRLRDFQRHAATHQHTTGDPDHPADLQHSGSHADGMDIDGADGGISQQAGSSRQQRQLVQMPVEFHYLLAGSQTSGQGTAHVDLYRVEVPGRLRALQPQQRVLMQAGTLHHVMRIPHGKLDVNRLAVMPQEPNIIATCSDEAEVFLFDLRHHAVAQPPSDTDSEDGQDDQQDNEQGKGEQGSSSGGSSSARSGSSGSTDSDGEGDSSQQSGRSGDPDPQKPQAELSGRGTGGFGLQFNPVKEGLLLGGDAQGGVQLWDVSRSAVAITANNVAMVPALQAVEGFAGCTINDLSWHRGGTAYALALESGEVWVQDMRMQASTADAGSSSAGCSSSVSLHGLTGFTGAGVQNPTKSRVHVRRSRQQRLQDLEKGGAANGTAVHDCFCVAFDPLHDYRLASGGADGYVKVLDMRRLDQPVEELGMHAGNVTSVAWSHSLPGLLVSGGDDGAVLLWDANKLRHAAAFGPQQQQQGQPVQQQHPQQQQGLGLPEQRHIRLSNLTESVRQYSLPGLLFMHGGHLGPVGSVALNAERPWLVASGSAGLGEGQDGAGRNVVVQRQPLMVWEPNTSEGLLC